MKSFTFTNARIVTSQEIFEGSLSIQNGKIVEIQRKSLSQKLKNRFSSELIDLQGKYIFPGLIDVHVHFRTPGMTQKEDWTSGSKAALAGGVTTVLDMPNTDPPVIDQKTLELKRSIVEKEALVNYGFYAGATLTNFEETQRCKNIAGIKIYMGSSTGTLLVDDPKILEKFFEQSKKLLALHAETESCIQKGFQEFGATDDPAVHSRIRSPGCAYQAVELALGFVKKYKTRVHFCHVSTAQELQLVAQFRKENPSLAQLISVEVTPHHLALIEDDYDVYGNFIKVNPPIRSEEDHNALWEGIRTGLVDIIATDHAPHLKAEKELPYSQVPSGMPGVQLMLPLLLDAANKGLLTLSKIAELTSYNPARLFGIEKKGLIAEGYDADLTVVDLEKTEKVCHHYLWSKANWSPFHGWFLKGWPVMTFVNGNLMYEWRETFGSEPGREVIFNN